MHSPAPSPQCKCSQCKCPDSTETSLCLFVCFPNTYSYTMNKIEVNFALPFTGMAVECLSCSDRSIGFLVLLMKVVLSLHSSLQAVTGISEAFCFKTSKSHHIYTPFHNRIQACPCEILSKTESLFISGKHPLGKNCLISALPASTPLLQLQKSVFPGDSDMSSH